MAQQFADNTTTTLNGTITSGAASLVLTAAPPQASGWAAGDTIDVLIDNELMTLTVPVSGLTWAIATRGLAGTTAASHTNGATIYFVLTSHGLANLGTKNIATGGQIAKVQLNFVAPNSADLFSARAITGNSTWQDIYSFASTFMVDDAASTVQIVVGGLIQNDLVGTGTFQNSVLAVRAVIDAAGTPVNLFLGGSSLNVSSGNSGSFFATNALSGMGPQYVSGLAVGAHTLKLQGFVPTGSTAASLYCRPNTYPVEGLYVNVVEFKR